jgi:hypothetical protein
MSAHSSHRRASLIVTILFPLASLAAFVRPAAAAPTIGFVERFPGTSLQGWAGGAVESNPGTGGLAGAGDGFLRFQTPNGFQHNLGVRSSGTEYLGNWTAAGIKQVRLWLRDVDQDDALEIHFSVGGLANLWQYNVEFLPPTSQWAQFVVDLTSPANWTQIVGTGTFASALAAVEVVHVRHDNAPYVQQPDPLDGDVGLDQILLTDGLAGVPQPASAARALELAPPAPNPSRGSVTLALESFDDGPARIEIVDAAGRLVRRHEHAAGAPGLRTWTWDGRDAAGRLAPPGWYRVRAIGAAGGTSRSLVRVE